MYTVHLEMGIINLFSSDFESQVIFPIEAMPADQYEHCGHCIQAAKVDGLRRVS